MHHEKFWNLISELIRHWELFIKAMKIILKKPDFWLNLTLTILMKAEKGRGRVFP